ncbi:TonB family protein [uncultured Fluviicola sp.]|uniref:TonB family protein n=1 Tax=uncultured Fluviicola sp. TaxID=463303 RepID=UPI0025D71CBF|nr:TonB family protein [uncultured Fluviicola sp.]
MNNYLWYFFEANVVITLLFGVFKLTQRFLSFGWQRFSLLSIPILSGLAVWIKHASISESSWSYNIPVFELEEVSITGAQEPAAVPFDYMILLEIAYWLGVGALSVWMLINIYRVLKVFLRAKCTQEEGFTLVELPNEAPSSFFRFIQLPAGLSEYDREIIFQHEKIHAQKYHSADRLFLETLHCFSWFNPVFLLLKKELVHIHEFEVDRIMYNKYRVGYMEFLLAYSLGTSSSIYLFTNQFMTKLTLIKRIKIMKKTSKRVLITALALPLIAGGFTLISFTSPDQEPTKKSTKKETPASKSKTTKEVKPAPKKQVVPDKKTEQVSKEASKTKEKDIYFVIPDKVESTTEMHSAVPQETEVDKMPEYVGGMEAMTKYMIANVRYPESAVKSKTTGKVIVSFVVTKDGKVTKATVKRGVSKELDAEALRVVSSMPNWIPGEKDGKKVDAEMILPVSFAL